MDVHRGNLVPLEAFLWMMVVLKIPVAMLLWLCWYAVKDAPEPAGEEAPADGGGGTKHPPRPHRPRPPRRGDHADLPLPPPSRTRVAARGTVPRP